jgi:hypothetical protein
MHLNLFMKTLNNHPKWHNQPLRLTSKEMRKPHIVIEDFFDCYHLQDVRDILWRWLEAVISSPQNISSEPLERSNHIYFYENVERIIEAAYVMKRKMLKHRLRKEKKKCSNDNNLHKPEIVKTDESIDSALPKPAVEKQDEEEILNKPKQLIEYVKEDPLHVIIEIFKRETFPSLHEQLRDLLHVALSADCSIYDEGEQRRQLLAFQDQLLVLIEALFIIYTQNRENTVKQKQEIEMPRLLTRDQIANPMHVITTFFIKFPITYCIRELNDFLEAGIAYAGTYPDNMSELQVLYTYRNVLCLVNAANQLLTKLVNYDY